MSPLTRRVYDSPTGYGPELAVRVGASGASPGRSRSDLDDLVLDPFAGSGTTLLAAARLERRSWGFELRPDYGEIALDRLSGSS